MTLESIKAIAVSLLTWINVNTEYKLPPEIIPEIHIIPASEVQDMVCGKPCPAYAWITEKADKIYLSDILKVDEDVCDRTILLHELVHFAQRKTNKFASSPLEERRHLMEMNAIIIQNIYLAEHGRRLIYKNGYAVRGLGKPYC